MVAAAALRQHRIAERDAGFEQRRELVKRDHQLLEAQPAAECGTRGRTPLVHLDHRMALGAQASNQLRDGAGLRCPFTSRPLRSTTSYSNSCIAGHSESVRRDM